MRPHYCSSPRRWSVNICLVVLLALAVTPPVAAGDTYRVTVTRKERNLYKIEGTKLFIKTKLCLEYATRESAILRYDRLAYDNILIFDQRPMPTTCEVEKLLEER